VRAVSNAGPLIHLSWIDRLDLLDELFEEVVVPDGVADEILRTGTDVVGGDAIRAALAAGWLPVRAVTDKAEVAALTANLGQGEAETLVLMAQENGDLLLVDDRRARDEAERRGVPFTGTIGLLREARERGLIEAAHPLVLRLRRMGFWVSGDLVDRLEREERGRGRAQ